MAGRVLGQFGFMSKLSLFSSYSFGWEVGKRHQDTTVD